MTRTMMRAMTRTFQLWRASEKKPHAQKTSMGHPASRFQASPISNRHLIHCPELDTDLTCTKQTAGHVSNRQFFAVFKLPDTASAGRKARKEDRDARSRGRSKQRPYEDKGGAARRLGGLAAGAGGAAFVEADEFAVGADRGLRARAPERRGAARVGFVFLVLIEQFL